MARFDVHARGYDPWYDTALGRYVDTVEKGLIAELAQPAPGERALDIGCGTGNHSSWLAQKGLNVTGLDESAAMLEVAAAKAAAGLSINWVLGDASALPFASGRFDLVVSVAALEFVADRRQVLREGMRVLRIGGRLVLGLLARDSPWGELYLRDGQERAGSVFAGAHLFTEDELPDLLEAPYTLRKGLYVPPDPDQDQAAAAQLEAEKQSLQENRAGFLAVRWVKGEPDSPVRGGFAAMGDGDSDA